MTQGFFIYDFFLDELGLDGTELTVYALIYSFSRVEDKGALYASAEYIAKRLHKSQRHVNLVLQTLIKKGLIERCKSESLSRCGYRTVRVRDEDKLPSLYNNSKISDPDGAKSRKIPTKSTYSPIAAKNTEKGLTL